jgi:hypothetical protein
MPQSPTLKFVLAIIIVLPLLGTGSILPDNGSILPDKGSIVPVNPVTVHEWGTFTSVAGKDGESVAWAPLRAASDLPCFVHSIGPAKYSPGLVRMETPVDYFYASAPAHVSVRVDFPDGLITEWYPKAANADPSGRIEWRDLNILPGANLTLPASKGASRYYAARATDSAQLQSGDENEKVLFYRGMGNFKVPIEPAVNGNGVSLRNNAADPIALAILFENQNGRIGYRIVHDLRSEAQLYAPELNATFEKLRGELIESLEQAGLYPKEAAAMIETWRDSWFEDGMRVIYLMPRAAVDRVLPMTVTPAPKEVQRVFVGRAELLSPWTEHTIRAAMETADTKTLNKFERFLPPFLTQIRAQGGLNEAPAATLYAQQVPARLGSLPCIQ